MTEPAEAVVTLTVNGVTTPFATVMLGAAQVAPNGTPEQTNVIVPLNPAPGEAVKLNCAV